MFPIAQLSASPEWTLAVGAFIIIALFLLGGGLMAVKLWKEIKGDPEPRHTPSVDTKIRYEVGAAEKRIGERVVQVEEKLTREHTQLHGRVSSLRDEIKADVKEVQGAVTDGVEKMQDMYAATCERIGRCEADDLHQTAALARLDRKCETLAEKKADK